MYKYLAFFITGVVLGMLVAPDKGASTRRRISTTVNDIPERVRQQVDRLTEKIDRLVGRAAEKIEDAAATVDRQVTGR